MSKLIDAIREELANLRAEEKEADRRARERTRRISYLQGIEDRERNQMRDNGVKAEKRRRRPQTTHQPAGYTEHQIVPEMLRLLARAPDGEMSRVALTEATATNGGNAHRATGLLELDGMVTNTGRKGGRAGKSPIFKITEKGRKEAARLGVKKTAQLLEDGPEPEEEKAPSPARPARRERAQMGERHYTVSDVGVSNLARVEAFLKREGRTPQKAIQEHLGHSGAGTVSKCVSILIDHNKARKFTEENTLIVEYIGSDRATVVKPGEGTEAGRLVQTGGSSSP